MKKLIDLYNRENTFIVISPYPKKGTLYNRTHGIVSFAKNTVNALLPHFSKQYKKIVVLADKLAKDNLVYKENKTLIVRCFKKNKLIFYIQLLNQLRKFNRVNQLLIQFDFSLYGDFIVTSLFPLFLFFLHFGRRKINLVLHSMVHDLKTISSHLGYNQSFGSKIKIFFYNFCLQVFYLLCTHLVTNVIVVEKNFVADLKKINPYASVKYIPHGVDIVRHRINRNKARKILHFEKKDFVVLYFGFVAWYKGADFLVNNFLNPLTIKGRNIRFLIAGGKSASLSNKKYYQQYYANLLKKLAKSKNITLTGFVKEQNISRYFKAADLVILPYRTLMASSGPLSFVFTYKKPFIFSNKLKSLFKNDYLHEAMKETQITEEDILFPLTRQDLIEKISTIMASKKLSRLKTLSSLARKKIVWNRLGEEWSNLLTSESIPLYRFNIISSLLRFKKTFTLKANQ